MKCDKGFGKSVVNAQEREQDEAESELTESIKNVNMKVDKDSSKICMGYVILTVTSICAGGRYHARRRLKVS